MFAVNIFFVDLSILWHYFTNSQALLPKMSEPKIVSLIVRAARILQTSSNENSMIGKISESV